MDGLDAMARDDGSIMRWIGPFWVEVSFGFEGLERYWTFRVSSRKGDSDYTCPHRFKTRRHALESAQDYVMTLAISVTHDLTKWMTETRNAR